MLLDLKTSKINIEDIIQSFKTSTKEEIKTFNLTPGSKYEIEIISSCPFTSIVDT